MQNTRRGFLAGLLAMLFAPLAARAGKLMQKKAKPKDTKHKDTEYVACLCSRGWTMRPYTDFGCDDRRKHTAMFTNIA